MGVPSKSPEKTGGFNVGLNQRAIKGARFDIFINSKVGLIPAWPL